MSIEPPAQRLRRWVLVTALTATAGPGCGWKLGPGPVDSLSVAGVRGAVVDPGLAEAVRDQVVRALRHHGVRSGGDSVVLALSDGGARVASAVPGHGGGALSEGLVLEASVPSRPGCAVSVTGRRTWAVDAAPVGVDNRGAARDHLARQLAERVVDALLGSEACRSPS